MRMYDIIQKKRDKEELTKEEIEYFVSEYSADRIPDYQASALLMAIYLNKLTLNELAYLTNAMANSAYKLDLSMLKREDRYIIDKHSTGGVGDKVTLIVLPIVASFGVEICKMSGRGLGITGGTADKLESIVGYDVNMPLEKAIEQVKEIRLCLISQSGDIAIADKKLYALRDVTATVESTDLIASSIMSKKIASGAEKVLLDVTAGSGAFMKKVEDAKILANKMVELGKLAGIETRAVITSMDEPLGRCVGNSVELKEVISFLLSDEDRLFADDIKDLREVVFEVAAQMIKLAGFGDDIEINKDAIAKSIISGSAYDKFIELVKAQGGKVQNVHLDEYDTDVEMPVLKDEVSYLKEITAEANGTIVSIDGGKIGEALVCLGGGRNKKEDIIDSAVGFEFKKKVGDSVREGEVILNCLFNDKNKFNEAFNYIKDAITISYVDDEKINELQGKPYILDII